MGWSASALMDLHDPVLPLDQFSSSPLRNFLARNLMILIIHKKITDIVSSQGLYVAPWTYSWNNSPLTKTWTEQTSTEDRNWRIFVFLGSCRYTRSWGCPNKKNPASSEPRVFVSHCLSERSSYKKTNRSLCASYVFEDGVVTYSHICPAFYAVPFCLYRRVWEANWKKSIEGKFMHPKYLLLMW